MNLLESTKYLLKKNNICPTKSKGQNFLISEKILNQIIDVSDLKEKENILEVGPGIGTLTTALLNKKVNLKVVELDEKMISILNQLKSVYDFDIIKGDILKIYLEKELGKDFLSNYKIVANLPYNISSHFLRIFFETNFRPKKMILMLQKEVAERIVVKDKKWSKLSLMCNYYSTPKIEFYVSKNNFYPAPEIDSAVISFSQIKKTKQELNWQLINFAYSSKRKTLVNNLSSGLRIDKSILEQKITNLGFDKNVRAEKLNILDWSEISRAFNKIK